MSVSLILALGLFVQPALSKPKISLSDFRSREYHFPLRIEAIGKSNPVAELKKFDLLTFQEERKKYLVAYFDSPDRALHKKGLIIRARCREEIECLITLKSRHSDLGELIPIHWKTSSL